MVLSFSEFVGMQHSDIRPFNIGWSGDALVLIDLDDMSACPRRRNDSVHYPDALMIPQDKQQLLSKYQLLRLAHDWGLLAQQPAKPELDEKAALPTKAVKALDRAWNAFFQNL
eukprot:1828920-Amphidinium_carterae.1